VIKLYRLEGEYLSDPWFTPRFGKYMNNPKRWAYKNKREV
jgi:hypothetical protein